MISNVAYSCIIPLLVHRFLRKLNQTGNKWAFIPDIGDWLNEEKNITVLLIVYISGISSLLGFHLLFNICMF